MELDKITEVLQTQTNEVIFGPRESLKKEKGNVDWPYIIFNLKEKTITFTTDTRDYLMYKKLEEAMEIIYSKFNITDYRTDFHDYPGKWHDKDIILVLDKNDLRKIPNIIKFIQDNFYKNLEWDFGYR